MKEVSESYKAGMARAFRDRSYVRINFMNIDVDAAADGQWSANGETEWSTLDTVDYQIPYADTAATLELNRWALDGSQAIWAQEKADDVNDGYVSSHFSSETGEYSTTPALTRTFNHVHLFRGLTITFDGHASEWPRQITVDYYRNNILLDSQTVYPDGPVAEVQNPSREVDKFTIRFSGGLPYRRQRVQYVIYGLRVTFLNDDVVAVDQKHDVDPLTRRLPSEGMTFTLLDYQQRYNPDNPNGDYSSVNEKSPISVQYGYTLPDRSVEWLAPDQYLLDGKPKTTPNRASFSGSGLIASLTGTYYKSKIGEKNLYDMADAVLRDSGVAPTTVGKKPWVIHESLKSMKTTAVLPITTHANCLQLIAHAACCRLYSDCDNVIHIKPLDFAPGFYTREDFKLGFRSMLGDDYQLITKIDQLKGVTVAKYQYLPETSEISNLPDADVVDW